MIVADCVRVVVVIYFSVAKMLLYICTNQSVFQICEREFLPLIVCLANGESFCKSTRLLPHRHGWGFDNPYIYTRHTPDTRHLTAQMV